MNLILHNFFKLNVKYVAIAVCVVLFALLGIDETK